MKKIYLPAILLIFVLSFAGLSSSAQKKTNYIPQQGYWQLVSNVHNKGVVTVQFYSEDNELMYQETVNNRMNVNRRKVRRQLYLALQEAYGVYAATHAMPVAKDLIAKRK
jgi:hypothetical protein